MSFVLCVCGMNFSTMMSDGRMIKLPNNDIVREDVSKVLKINKNVAIAYTGDPIPVQIAINKLKEYNIGQLSMENIEKIIIAQLKNLSLNILGAKIIFTGRNMANQFVIHTLDSKDDFKVNVTYPSTLGITYACAGNNYELCNQIVQQNFSNVEIKTSKQLEDVMSKCICDVAKIDKTVNTNIYKVVII